MLPFVNSHLFLCYNKIMTLDHYEPRDLIAYEKSMLSYKWTKESIRHKHGVRHIHYCDFNNKINDEPGAGFFVKKLYDWRELERKAAWMSCLSTVAHNNEWNFLAELGNIASENNLTNVWIADSENGDIIYDYDVHNKSVGQTNMSRLLEDNVRKTIPTALICNRHQTVEYERLKRKALKMSNFYRKYHTAFKIAVESRLKDFIDKNLVYQSGVDQMVIINNDSRNHYVKISRGNITWEHFNVHKL